MVAGGQEDGGRDSRAAATLHDVGSTSFPQLLLAVTIAGAVAAGFLAGALAAAFAAGFAGAAVATVVSTIVAPAASFCTDATPAMAARFVS